jgi:hypothetical protein
MLHFFRYLKPGSLTYFGSGVYLSAFCIIFLYIYIYILQENVHLDDGKIFKKDECRFNSIEKKTISYVCYNFNTGYSNIVDLPCIYITVDTTTQTNIRFFRTLDEQLNAKNFNVIIFYYYYNYKVLFFYYTYLLFVIISSVLLSLLVVLMIYT